MFQRRKLAALWPVQAFDSSCLTFIAQVSLWSTQESIIHYFHDSLQGAITSPFHCSRGQDIHTCLLWWGFWSSPSSGSGSLCHTFCHWRSPQPVSLALTRILRYVMRREKKLKSCLEYLSDLQGVFIDLLVFFACF